MALELLRVPQQHLVLWWEGPFGLAYCRSRRSLVKVDYSTVVELLSANITDNESKVGTSDLYDLLSNPNAKLTENHTLQTSYLRPNVLSRKDNEQPSLYFIHGSFTAAIRCNIGDFSARISDELNIGACSSTETLDAPYQLSIIRDDCNYWSIFEQGMVQFSSLTERQVLPLLIDLLMIACYRIHAPVFALHAGLIAFEGRLCVISGASGVGKSTLSLSLMAAGGALYSDEVAAFNQNFSPLLLPFPASVKSGSWKALSGLLNEGSFTWERRDGRQVKYVRPAMFEKASYSDPPLIIYPQFDASLSSFEFQTVNTVTAVESSTSAGYELPGGETEEGVAAFIRWVENSEKVAFRYGSTVDLPAAVKGYINATS